MKKATRGHILLQFSAYVIIGVIQFPLLILSRGLNWVTGWLDYQYWQIIRRDLRLP